MNSSVARLLNRYASCVLPETVKKKVPRTTHLLYRWLKEHWNTLSHKERGAFKRHIKAGKPLPESWKRIIAGCRIPLEWPPKSPEVPKPRKRRGKSSSWHNKKYGEGYHAKK